MLILTLTPEQEHKIKTIAQRKQKPVETVLDEWLADTASEEVIAPKPKSGAEVLASWKKKGVLSKAFMDRPEDAPELARKFQALADGHEEGDL